MKDFEWDIVSDASAVLKDLTDTTTYMCAEKSVSVSEIYPVVCGLLQNSLTRAADDSLTAGNVKDAISAELRHRYKPSDRETAKSVPMVASLLDCRYKCLSFISREQKTTAREMLEFHMDEVPLRLQARDQTEETPAKRPRLSFLVGSSTERKSSSDELDNYMVEKSQSDVDPLVWRQQNEQRFPTIAHVARKVLCVPATSVPSERIFSSSGLLINKLRNRLSSDIVDKIIFLNKN